MTILVTGGTGYIGAHVVRLLRDSGRAVVIVDDLVNGRAERNPGVPILEIDLADPSSRSALIAFMSAHQVDAVIHFAARKQVAESVARPEWYYQQNVGGLANVLSAMRQLAVGTIVFSSSAAVYGATEGEAVPESAPTVPVNPYGDTKLIGERMIGASVAAYSLRACSLRYFNVAGAGWPELGDTAVLNLVPMVLERVDAGESPQVFGDTYSTTDGTCVRDYIHVMDLAEAHIVALEHLSRNGAAHSIFNDGTGVGSSVLDVISEVAKATGKAEATPVILPPRPGDPAAVVADPRLITESTGWHAKRGLHEIVASAWESHVFLGARAALDR